MKDGEKAVTAQYAADCIGVTTPTLYRMAKRGIIPCFFVGQKRRGVRFFISEVIEALTDRPVNQ